MKKRVLKVCNPAPEFRKKRIFSEELKRKIVKEIGTKLHTVAEIQRLYDVSAASVYRWVYKFTPGLVPGVTQVVQMESEAERTKKLIERVSELERVVGQKQLTIDLLEKVLEYSSTIHGFDQKKSFLATQLSGSASTVNSIGTK